MLTSKAVRFSSLFILLFTISAVAEAVAVGDRVAANGNVNVRSTYSTSASIITTEASGSTGAISNGPQSGSGYTWWYINWDNGYTGWSADASSLTLVAPSSCTAVSPGTSSQPGPTLSSLSATFNWNSAEGAASYEVLLIDIDNASNQYIWHAGTSTSLSSSLTAGHRYSWDVQGENSAGQLGTAANALFFVAPTLTLTPTWTWSPTPNRTQTSLVATQTAVAQQATMTQVALQATQTSIAATQTALAGGQSGVTPSITPTRTWTPTRTPTPVPVPVLLSPGGPAKPGAVATNLQPTLSWQTVSGASNYGIYVTNVDTGQSMFSSDAVGNVLTLALPDPLTAGDNYRWQARAYVSGVGSPLSAPFYFQAPLDLTLTAASGFKVYHGVFNSGRGEHCIIADYFDSQGQITLDVLDAAAIVVRNIYAGSAGPGTFTAKWDGLDDGGRPVASGVYVIRCSTGGGTLEKRVVVLR